MAKERKQGGGSRRSKPKSASETMPIAAEPEGAASGATAPANATPAAAKARHGATTPDARDVRSIQSRQTPAILDSRRTGRTHPAGADRRSPRAAGFSAAGRRLDRVCARSGQCSGCVDHAAQKRDGRERRQHDSGRSGAESSGARKGDQVQRRRPATKKDRRSPICRAWLEPGCISTKCCCILVPLTQWWNQPQIAGQNSGDRREHG